MVFLLDSLEAAGEAVAPEIESAVGGEIRSVASEAAGDIGDAVGDVGRDVGDAAKDTGRDIEKEVTGDTAEASRRGSTTAASVLRTLGVNWSAGYVAI